MASRDVAAPAARIGMGSGFSNASVQPARSGAESPRRSGYPFWPQHFLNFLPLPQGHWSLRPVLGGAMKGFGGP
jgi:hypothetical protein